MRKRLLASTALLGAIAPLVVNVQQVEAKRSVTGTANGRNYYTVRSGDSLWGIGNDFGVTVNDLAKWNSISNTNLIKPGQRIYLEAEKSAPISTPTPKPEPAPKPDPKPTPPQEEDEDEEEEEELVIIDPADVIDSTNPFFQNFFDTVDTRLNYRDGIESVGSAIYTTKNGKPLHLVMELMPHHPNHAYYINQGMYRTDVMGKKRVYLYLQHYKGKYFYYSPVYRYYDNDLGNYVNGRISKHHHEIGNRIKGMSSLRPNNNKRENWVRGNSTYQGRNPSEHGTGQHEGHSSMNYYARRVGKSGEENAPVPLNWGNPEWVPGHRYPSLQAYHNGGYIGGQHNFRRYFAKPMYEASWTVANLTLASDKGNHVDGYQKNMDSHSDSKYVNRWGEYRWLGYYSTGEEFWNPYFPVDGMAAPGRNGLQSYPFRAYPWAQDDNYNSEFTSKMDRFVFQYALRTNYDTLAPGGAHSHLRKYLDPSVSLEEAREAYEEKYDAMLTLYEHSYDLQVNMRNDYNGGLSGHAAVEALTMKYGSLKSDPMGIDDVTVAEFQRDSISHYDNGKPYRYSLILQSPYNEYENPHDYHDTQIVEQKIYRDGNLLQTFKRNTSNGQTTVTNSPYSEKEYGKGVAPEVEPGERLEVKTNVYIVDAYRDANQNSLDYSTSLNPTWQRVTLNDTQIRANKDNVFGAKLNVPDVDDDMTFDINAQLDKQLYQDSFDMLFDSTGNTAKNTLKIIVDRGNFGAESTELIDEQGNVVRDPVPGNRYKIRFNYRYLSDNNRDARRNTTLQVNYQLGRQMVGSPIHGRDESRALTAHARDSNGNIMKTFKPKHNTVYSFDSDYHYFETAQFDAMSDIVVGLERYDLDTSDNKLTKDWSSFYDIAVENVRVVPNDTVNTQDQVAEMLVQFDIDYMTPAHIKDLGQNVEFLVDLDGETVLVNEHIRKGKNRNISIPIEIPLEGNVDRVLEARVLANPDRKVYEEDVYSANRPNNIGVGTGQVKNDIVQPHYDSNRQETWTQYVHENNWSGSQLNYRTFSNNLQRTFLRFTSKDNPRSTSRFNLFENYQIDSVRFRSRLTRQRELGNDGWVDLMQEDGYIKAGYGYELEIDVSYNTNAMDQIFENSMSANGTTGRWSRPQLSEPLLQDNVYIEMQDGHIRSVQGDGGTEQALRVKDKSENNGKTTWTFEIDGGTILGAPTVGRFYIGEDVADGRYPLTVFTPKIRGVNGKQINSTNALEYLLYDSANDLGINVEGAASDDITDHINR